MTASDPFQPDLEVPLNDNKASQELLSLVQLFRKLSIHMLAEVEKVTQKLKPDLLELALLTCEKFLSKKLENPQELSLLLSAAVKRLSSLRSLSSLKIFLHPEDLQNLHTWMSTHEIPLIKHAEFLPDTTCKRACYKIEIPEGILRQDIGEELDHLLSVLMT
ncbi:flagellar biosynthesis protein [Chlamydia sp. 17-3921]|uniref:flagellar biosynthesis protein n=1 Tax=Chlamydia sp. 17-3921 TaxID=2675798 RepID=UPI001F21442F|nr:flagellar biosynthesis protein [Chlamydia sp. 17-3921]